VPRSGGWLSRQIRHTVPVADLVAGVADLVSEEPVTELRVVTLGVEDGAGEVGLVELSISDRLGKPPVVVLASDLEDPARHRHGDPVWSCPAPTHTYRRGPFVPGVTAWPAIPRTAGSS